MLMYLIYFKKKLIFNPYLLKYNLFEFINNWDKNITSDFSSIYDYLKLLLLLKISYL